MDSLLDGMKRALQEVVGRLYGAVVLWVKHASEAPQSSTWYMLPCAVLLALLIWRMCVLRRKQEAARGVAAQLEEDGESSQHPGLTRAPEDCRRAQEGARPLRFQTLRLCSADPHPEVAGLDSLFEDYLDEEETSELSIPGRVTAPLEVQARLFKEPSNSPQGQDAETKNTFQVSQKDITLIEEEMLHYLVKIAIPRENQEAAKWREGAWDMKEQQTFVKIPMNE